MRKYTISVHKSSTRDIDYTYHLGCYTYAVNRLIEDDSTVIHIIDAPIMYDSVFIANAIRKRDSYAPILIIIDTDYTGNLHEDVMKIKGFGKLSFVHFYPGPGFTLMRHVEEMIVPQSGGNTSDIAVAIPVYNEEPRLKYVKALLHKLKALIDYGDYNISVFLIDDGSEDQTFDKLAESIHEDMSAGSTVYRSMPLNIRRLSSNTRKAGTYLDAFSGIDSEYIVTLDADDSFNIEDIVKMIHLSKLGYYDMVIGTKDNSIETRQISRQMLSAFKRTLTSVFLPKGVTDSQTGLKVFRKSAIMLVLPYLRVEYGLALDLELMFLAKKMHLRVLEKSVTIIDREGSHINIVVDTIHFLISMVHMSMHQSYRKLV